MHETDVKSSWFQALTSPTKIEIEWRAEQIVKWLNVVYYNYISIGAEKIPWC